MFIHGAGRTPASWGPQLARFEGALAVALPGHPDGAPLHGTAAMADWVIAEMEGVQEKLANIGRNNFQITASRNLFNAILADKEKPPVLSAIMKLMCTEKGR
ncbi:MAG: hypothetical protein ACPG7S_02565, partial [Miltoncostaeaceae bacterium]